MGRYLVTAVFLILFSHGSANGDSPRYWKSSREPEVSMEDLKQQISLIRNSLRNQEVELSKLKEKAQSHDQMVDALVDNVENSTKKLKGLNWNSKFESIQSEIDEIKHNANKIADAVAADQTKTERLQENLETIESALTTIMDALGIKNENIKVYTVKPGDSLGSIAMKNRTTVSKIKTTNRLKSDKIIVGQKLKMP